MKTTITALKTLGGGGNSVRSLAFNPQASFSNSGFTLAEVLITLGIIGIVAAMTIPGIIVDYKIKQTISKLKKVQTTFSNAVLMAVNEYGPIDTWGLVKDDKESAQILGIRLKPYLKILDDCGTGNCENYTGQWHLLNGIFQSNVTDYKLDFYYKLRLADGAEVFLRPPNTLHVDINGNKTPNVMGKDIFRFYISDNGKVNLTGVGENPNSA